MSRLLGTTDVALRIGVSAEYVRQLERSGRLPAEKTVSGQRIFKEDDVEKLLREREAVRAAASADCNQ